MKKYHSEWMEFCQKDLRFSRKKIVNLVMIPFFQKANLVVSVGKNGPEPGQVEVYRLRVEPNSKVASPNQKIHGPIKRFDMFFPGKTDLARSHVIQKQVAGPILRFHGIFKSPNVGSCCYFVFNFEREKLFDKAGRSVLEILMLLVAVLALLWLLIRLILMLLVSFQVSDESRPRSHLDQQQPTHACMIQSEIKTSVNW